MESGDIKRLLKGVLIGGLGAVLTLSSALALFYFVTQNVVEYSKLIASITSLVMFSLFTVWATGFWGRWGMILFFILAPVALIIDFTINPLFPAGVILFAALCFALRSTRHNA
jgi:hypothetical protein